MSDLKTVRFFKRLSQVVVANQSGVSASRISNCENGHLVLNPAEKSKIEKVLGKVDWVATERQEYSMQMPREEIYHNEFDIESKMETDPELAYDEWLRKEMGLKIVRDHEMAMPRIVPISEE